MSHRVSTLIKQSPFVAMVNSLVRWMRWREFAYFSFCLASNLERVNRHPSSASLSFVLLSILVPVGIICILFVFFCWCCHHRNNTSHLSSCSSTSTPIKKSSHLVNTVTSSPFRSSIVAHHAKPLQRPLPSSSSSSANTNLTNAYLRQTLLRSEAKRPTNHLLPSPGASLPDIPLTNIRFLQELGEGMNVFLSFQR